LKKILPDVMVTKPGNAVNQGRLAGSVGADDAQDVSLVHVETDTVQRQDAAEALVASSTWSMG